MKKTILKTAAFCLVVALNLTGCHQKIKELAMKNKDINKVSSIIFEYEQEIKEIKKQIENENQILLQLKKDYKNLSDEAEKIRKLS